MKITIVFLLSLFLVLVTVSTVLLIEGDNFITSSLRIEGNNSAEPAERKDKNEGAATIVFVGDVMLDRYVDAQYKKEGNRVFDAVKELSDSADAFVFNHEGVFPDKDIPRSLRSLRFSFRSNPVSDMRDAGADIAGLANNHSYDFGSKIYNETKTNLKSAGFSVFGHPVNGSLQENILHKTIKKKKVALYGYNSFSVKRADIITALKENTEKGQLDIVFSHWGDEYSALTPLQTRTAKMFHNAGADVIIGHHPHIVQKYEKFSENAITFYSLGNFIFDQYFSQETQHGLALQVVLKENKATFNPIPVSLFDSIPKLKDKQLLDSDKLYPGFSIEDKIEIENF